MRLIESLDWGKRFADQVDREAFSFAVSKIGCPNCFDLECSCAKPDPNAHLGAVEK